MSASPARAVDTPAPSADPAALARAIRHEAHGDRVILCYRDRPGSVDAMMAAAAAAGPDREAIVDGDRRMTHAELRRATVRVSAGLSAAGLVPGDRVALLVGNRLEFVVALYGAIHAGLIVVPIGIRSRAPEIAHVLNDCGAAMIIADGELADALPDRADGPSLRRVVLVGPPNDALSGLPSAEGPVPDPGTHEDDVAVILYTSGTTGAPKGATLTHLGIVHSSIHFAEVFRLTADDRAILTVPASHVTGLIALVTAVHGAGGTLILQQKFDAREFLELAARERLTYTILVPAMYNLCLIRARLADYDLSAWRIGGFGGAPMPEATIERLAEELPGLHLCNAYGATEVTSPATLMPPGDGGPIASVGRVVPCGEIRVMDPDGREVPAGEPGEIWIAGPMVVPGYWNNPAKTAESFRGGFWKSGDIGRVDADGYVYVFDRVKDMINRAGYKVFSAEVEGVLVRHDRVVEAAVLGEPDPVLGEKTHAVLYCEGGELDEADVKAFCGRFLSDYKVPDRITVLSEPLPRNLNGKLMKHVLKERFRAG